MCVGILYRVSRDRSHVDTNSAGRRGERCIEGLSVQVLCLFIGTAWKEKADTFSHFSSPFIYKPAHLNVTQISGIRAEERSRPISRIDLSTDALGCRKDSSSLVEPFSWRSISFRGIAIVDTKRRCVDY